MIDPFLFQNKLAAYYTLGCKLNFAETSAIGRILGEHGIRKASDGERADICVVNTCSVTELADKKCRQAIRRITRENPGAFVIVTGCYAQLSPDEVADIEGVDLVLGNDRKDEIVQFLHNICKNDGKGLTAVSPTRDMKRFIPSCSAEDRTRHFLKVQDGCDYFCSYCTIPMARGRSRNGKITDLVRQAREVAENGGREIVLTGVNIGDFGRSTGEDFISLLLALEMIREIERFRISSIEPNLLTDELIGFVGSSEQFMPHFHIPLQSGSDASLRLMKRRYDTALFKEKTERIRELMPDAFIGVDMIVGMRGETDELFRESCRFIEDLDISRIHVFTYSERAGTQALKIDHEVPLEVRQERSRILSEISERKLAAFYDRHIGHRAAVLFEHTQYGEVMKGFTGNYIRVEAPYDSGLVNKIVPVLLGEWNGSRDALKCTIESEV
jgi:threonylcarbamoyladenosine tRNA methylthiotransferase MtaB